MGAAKPGSTLPVGVEAKPGSTPPGGGYPPAQPQVPAQGGKGNMPLPANYQSQYGNYGFDSGLQNYLDQQYVGSTRDAGVGYQYDPSTQTFTGGTMGGRYNPIPLSVMQQAAGGNRDVLNPYFQSRFPQPTGPVPTVKPGTFNPFDRPGQPQTQPMNPYEGMTQVGPGSYERLDGSPGSMQPSTSMTPLQKSMMDRYNPQRPQPQTQPMNPQRGLGGLQSLMNKFRNRLG